MIRIKRLPLWRIWSQWWNLKCILKCHLMSRNGPTHRELLIWISSHSTMISQYKLCDYCWNIWIDQATSDSLKMQKTSLGYNYVQSGIEIVTMRLSVEYVFILKPKKIKISIANLYWNTSVATDSLFKWKLFEWKWLQLSSRSPSLVLLFQMKNF